MRRKVVSGGKVDPLEAKIARLKSGAKPRVLDLFAGCGGISLGFHSAGFTIEAAMELDVLAAATHARNFHGALRPDEVAAHAQPRDITTTEPEQLVEELGLGGPPPVKWSDSK